MSIFFNDPATTEIYTLSLHDALPISLHCRALCSWERTLSIAVRPGNPDEGVTRRWTCQGGIMPYHCGAVPQSENRRDRKSTRLNSSHGYISYAVFCLKKKKTTASHRR